MLYILDPANIIGDECDVETFKALRNREVREFGKYRTQQLILDAWDRLELGQRDRSTATGPIAATTARGREGAA